jgi:hypothetical protein
MRRFQRRSDGHGRKGEEVAYVAGPSSLSSQDWIEDRTFSETAARFADPGIEAVFQRARQVGLAFVRPTRR